MKYFITALLIFTLQKTNAQKIDSIFVNLYTDSLKKGTYNYINIVGVTDKEFFIPLDTTQLVFKSSDGDFFGNSLFIAPDYKKEKVTIEVFLKQNPALKCRFDIYIKKHEDTTPLPTESEIIKRKTKKA